MGSPPAVTWVHRLLSRVAWVYTCMSTTTQACYTVLQAAVNRLIDPQRGNVCPARARRATFLLTIPTSAPDLPSHGEAPQVDHIALHTFPTLQNKAGSVTSTTPAVICSVIDKQHWSHKCGCQYIHYNSAPYTHHKLRRWSTVGKTTHTLLPHPLPHLAWRPSCFGQSKPEAGHAPMVRRGG